MTLLLVAVMSSPAYSKALGEAPASIVELTISSNGDRMSGIAYLAAGKEPHPTILLLHGYPGNEKNLDVAQAMRRKGWNVVFFHYRGAWGSEGEFSIINAEQDVQNVLQYITDDNNNLNHTKSGTSGKVELTNLVVSLAPGGPALS